MESVLQYDGVHERINIRATTPGQHAEGEVNIQAREDGRTYTGLGAHTDVERASADAFLHAVNEAAAAWALEESHLAATSDSWGA
jgi:hypothetical protein